MDYTERGTSIIISTHNLLDYTKACIESIRQYTKDTPYDIIVIHDRLAHDSVAWLKTQTDKIIICADNADLTEAYNQGIGLAKEGNDILLMNSDIIATQNWLQNLKTALHSESEIGAVGSVTNQGDNYQYTDMQYDDLDEMRAYTASNNVSDSSRWERCLRLSGFCMLIKREALDKIGLLDNRFTPGCYLEDDYCCRLVRNGYKLLVCADSFVHRVTDYPLYNPVDDSDLMRNNHDAFKNKWGFSPSYCFNTRFDIISLIKRHKSARFRILEVGCACGTTLLRLKHLYPNCEVFGIELNPETAKIAATFADVSSCDIENKSSLSFPDAYFDYIIFGDVLEHLYDPWTVLSNIRRHLKPTGKVIASIPNIMHASVLCNLLCGEFNYTEQGILDRTHLRFFTLKTIIEMFLQAGYSTSNPIGKIVRLPGLDQIANALVSITSKDYRMQYNVFQYIIIATPSRTEG